MKNKTVIMNPVALGWLIVIGLVSIIIGIAVGFSSGAKGGIVTAIIVFALFGGIEGMIIFFSDQSLLRGSKSKSKNNPNQSSEPT